MQNLDNLAVVIDNGTGLVKCGFSGEDSPRVVFPSLVGRPKYENFFRFDKDYYIGEEAFARKGVLQLSYPLEHGVVSNWDYMEKIWEYSFTEQLRVKPQERRVFLTEAPLNPKVNREKMTSIMFESFGVQSIYIGIQALLSLYASGRITGVVVDSGDGVTHIVPAYDGFSLAHSIVRINLAGRDINELLVKLLSEIGVNLSSSSEREIARDIKEKTAYFAENFQEELKKSENSNFCEIEYSMPDGSKLKIGSQRFRAPELLFDPSIIGSGSKGVHEAVSFAIREAEIDLRKSLYSNITLSGGNTLIPGIEKRLKKEIIKLTPYVVPVKIISLPDRKFSVWYGASVLSSLNSFETCWLSKEEYEEYGENIIHKKFF